ALHTIEEVHGLRRAERSEVVGQGSALVDVRDQAAPEWRRGAGAADFEPAGLTRAADRVVDGYTRVRVGVGRNVGRGSSARVTAARGEGLVTRHRLIGPPPAGTPTDPSVPGEGAVPGRLRAITPGSRERDRRTSNAEDVGRGCWKFGPAGTAVV